MPSDVCAQSVIATLESMRVSSSTAIAYCSAVPPAPPTDSGNGIPIQPELAHLAHELQREGLRAVELLGDRRDLAHGEVADGAAQQLGLVVQVEVHGAEPYAASASARSTSSRTPQPVPP